MSNRYIVFVFLLFIGFLFSKEPVLYAQSESTVFGKYLDSIETSISDAGTTSTRKNIVSVPMQTSNSLAAKVSKGGWLIVTIVVALSWIVYLYRSSRQ